MALQMFHIGPDPAAFGNSLWQGRPTKEGALIAASSAQQAREIAADAYADPTAGGRSPWLQPITTFCYAVPCVGPIPSDPGIMVEGLKSPGQ